MQLFFVENLEGPFHKLSQDESAHCVRVLRKRTGDLIRITNGQGLLAEGKITKAHPSACEFEVLSRQNAPRENYAIHIGISPTKQMERIEWFVEKATEIGVHEISFLKCKNSERGTLKIERLQKKMTSAAKQSLRASFPLLNEMTTFQSFLSGTSADEKFIAHMNGSSPPYLHHAASKGKKYTVVIGPEGDFCNTELLAAREAGYMQVSLGQNRLRTETAGIVACQMLAHLNLG